MIYILLAIIIILLLIVIAKISKIPGYIDNKIISDQTAKLKGSTKDLKKAVDKNK